jgi:hypothetical protein
MDSHTFTPMLMMCSHCEYPLQSTYPGEFSACPKHGSFVDQTHHYSRHGGCVSVDREAMEEAWGVVSGLEWWVCDEEVRQEALVWMEEMADLWEDAEDE